MPQTPQNISDERLPKLVALCETLQERLDRLSAQRMNTRGSKNSQLDQAKGSKAYRAAPIVEVETFADAWQTILAGSQEDDRLARRFQWSRWCTEDLQRALGSSKLSKAGQGQLPPWALIIGKCSRAVFEDYNSQKNPQSEGIAAMDRGERPFDQILAPVLSFAKQELGGQLNNKHERISASLNQTVLNELTDWLSKKLVALSQDTFYAAFCATRPLLQNLLLDQAAASDRQRSFQLYDAFIDKQGGSGLWDIFDDYPMLARLMGATIANWLDACIEFTNRLDDDWNSIAKFAGFDPNKDHVTHMECGLSDPHHQGRSVFIVAFSNGAKVVYKPRDLSLDHQLKTFAQDLLKDCTANVRLPRVLAKTGYGWMEFIDAIDPVRVPTDQRFWRNSGALLGLLHVLDGRDIHFENIIATDDGFVMIDAEVMFSVGHALGNKKPPAETIGQMRELDNIVRSTGLLPEWFKVGLAPDQAIDASGFGSLFPDPKKTSFQTAPPKTVWTATNSDQMRPYRSLKGNGSNTKQTEPASGNEAKTGLDLGITDELIDNIIDGFTQVYQAVRDAGALELKQFSNVKTRLIHRPTRTYGLLLQEAIKPEKLRSGLTFGLQLEKSMGVGAAEQSKPHIWPIYEDSLKQMTGMDVPYYCVTPNETGVRSSRDKANSLISTWESGLDSVSARLASLSPARLQLQNEYIRTCFEARRASDNDKQPVKKTLIRSAERDPRHADDLLLNDAIGIADLIKSRAVRYNGQTSWMTSGPWFGHGHLCAKMLGGGLYDGTSGIALFLAALDHTLGERIYEPIWVDALKPSYRWVSNTADIQGGGLGLADGFGGNLYCCALLRDLGSKEQRDWIDVAAERFIAAITKRKIAGDNVLDIMGGAAGAIIGLLAYNQSVETPLAVEKAVLCAEHLLAKYGPLSGRVKNNGRTDLCGMSHGAAGIALAMGRLGQLTGDQRYMRAVSHALDFEERHYKPETKNWRDLREDTTTDMRAWCHGAPGIALARGGLVEVGADKSDDRIGRDWQRAVEGSRFRKQTSIDHMCCGLAGEIECLLHHGLANSDQQLINEAQGLTDQMARAAREQGTPRLFWWDHPTVFVPGFFRGLSGIGYSFLRAKSPTVLPSVLGFQTVPLEREGQP